jgi:glycerol-3-phosphate dehydrogenase
VQRTIAPAERRSGSLLPRAKPIVRVHSDVARGLVSLAGASPVLAYAAAKQAIDAIGGELGNSSRPRRHGDTLPYAHIADSEGRIVETTRDLGIEVDPDVTGHLVNWYGTEAPDVLRFSAERRLLGRVSGTPVLDGEIVYAAAMAGARQLADVVLRRTPLGATGHPGENAVSRAAALLASEFGWSDARRDAEIARVDAAYAMPSSTRPTPSPDLDPVTARSGT